jgi:ubiquinone/menaquinone biosynthesis C-methylase UbiE
MLQASPSGTVSTTAGGATGSARSDRWEITLTEADSVMESLWDQDAVAWDRYWVPIFRLFAEDLLRIASPSPGDVVLDLGTGSGVAAIEASGAIRSVSLVVGIDRSDTMIALARKRARQADSRNIRFIKMSGEDLRFPDGFFDCVISNCGIGASNYNGVLKEIKRVLKPGGAFVFNDWHLIDVKPHRIFGEVLSKHRTKSPSPLLARERSAIARMESYHHSLSTRKQVEMILNAGFGRANFWNRRYRVHMRGVRDYLKMRSCRATIRREISEMSAIQRRLFLSELKERLQDFVKGDRFAFDWGLFYIHAEKQ